MVRRIPAGVSSRRFGRGLGFTPLATADDPVNDVAGFQDLRFGDHVIHGRPDPPRRDESGVAQHAQMLTRIREAHADSVGQLGDRCLTVAERVQEHQSLRVHQDLAEVGMPLIVVGVVE